MKLTAKQEMFIREYLVDLNATQAAIRAGYSKKTAYAIGEENLRKPEIAEAIQKAMDERAQRTQITADRVLEEYAKIGFSNITDFLQVKSGEMAVKVEGPDGPYYSTETVQHVHLFDTDDIDEGKMRAVAEIKQTRDGIALKLHDKKGALDSVARHLGMFTDKVQHSGGLVIINGENSLED